MKRLTLYTVATVKLGGLFRCARVEGWMAWEIACRLASMGHCVVIRASHSDDFVDFPAREAGSID